MVHRLWGGARKGLPATLEPALARLWHAGPGAVFALSQATHGAAIIRGLLQASGPARHAVWVPDYYCDGALHHFRHPSIRLVFYPVDDRLRPDWAACAALLAEGPPVLFMLVHYFGTVNDLAAARAFCDRQGALLLEDAVHVLRPVGVIGSAGDFTCYSPRKYLDLPDGGLLAVRGQSLAARGLALAEALQPAAPDAWSWRLRHLLPRLPARRGPAAPLHVNYYAPQPPPVAEPLMSGAARRRLAGLVQGGGMAAAEAEQNRVRSTIEQALSGWHGLRPLPVAEGATPYFFAMRGPDEATVALALAELRAAGAMVATWPGLPPEIIANPERHAAAFHVRRTLLRFVARPMGRRRPLDFLAALGQRGAATEQPA